MHRSYPSIPNYTSNDIYGSYYDHQRIALDATPDRVKNYGLDERKRRYRTTGGEYGSFLAVDGVPRPPRWYVVPDTDRVHPSRVPGQYVPENIGQVQQLTRSSPPPPRTPRTRVGIMESQLPPAGVQTKYGLFTEYGYGKEVMNPPAQQPQQQMSPRETQFSPPPAAPPAPQRSQSPVQRPDPPPPPPLQQSVRSVAPPPPPPPVPSAPFHQSQRQAPVSYPVSHGLGLAAKTSHDTQAATQLQQLQQPVLRYGDKVINLPDIDAVEFHMTDKSRIILSLKEFYKRHLMD